MTALAFSYVNFLDCVGVFITIWVLVLARDDDSGSTQTAEVIRMRRYYGVVVLEGGRPPEAWLRGHLHNRGAMERAPRVTIVCAFASFAMRALAHRVVKAFGVKLWDVQRAWLSADELVSAQRLTFATERAFRGFLEHRLSDEYVLDESYGRVE